MVVQAAGTAVSDRGPADPFFYGFREIRDIDEFGHSTLGRLPLTRRQLLHPGESDYEMASHLHSTLIHYLRYVLELVLSRLPGSYVLSDVDIVFDDPRQLTYRPDLMAIFNVNPKFDWRTFRVREEGVGPRLIIEVTSPATRANDQVEKFSHYARYGVEWYLIVDLQASTATEPVPLYCYQLRDGVYRPVPAALDGWLWLAPIGVWLVGEIGDVACYDEHRRLIVTPTEEHAARVATEAELAQAIARADQATALAAEAMARENEALTRENEALAQAATEATARQAVEAQLAEALARLRQLQPDIEP